MLEKKYDRAGWLVFNIPFFELHDDQPTEYKLKPYKRLLNINGLVRMKGIKFDHGNQDGPRFSLRCGSRPHSLMSRLSEDMHYTVMTGGGEDSYIKSGEQRADESGLI